SPLRLIWLQFFFQAEDGIRGSSVTGVQTCALPILNDPSGLEQLLLRDVEEHTGNTAVEKTIQPKIVKQAEVLEGVGMESAPALRSEEGRVGKEGRSRGSPEG